MVTEDEQPSPSDIAAMLTDQTSACEAARDAIAAGGEVVLWDSEVPQWMAVGIASRRLRTSSKRGQPTLALDETVEILARHRGEQLRTGSIDAVDRVWFFNLYFDATGTEILACSGVKRSPRPGTEGWSDQAQPR